MATEAEGKADNTIKDKVGVAVLAEDGGLSNPKLDVPLYSLKKREAINAMV